MHRSLPLLVSLLALAAPASAEAPFQFERTPGQLPKTVVPHAYRIEITPDLAKLALTGRELIDIDVHGATDTITLNQAGLTLDSAVLENGSAAKIALDESAETAALTFSRKVPAGPHTLTIAYHGPILQSPNGIYADDYKTAEGAARRMLVTQFEVGDARRMFPGWDEPAFKATFQLSVTLPKALAAVSNMPIASTKPVSADAKRVEFMITPRMSTYLLALVAGDMADLDGTAVGTAMHAWTPTGLQDQARYALDVEQMVLPYYNEYFGVPYPLPKLDLIAIPGNYEAGAMENWGAITFIDSAMLFDPATSAPPTREEIFLSVAHEMAHQWSGDLVTMAWWDNLWLNEGFATWMEDKAGDRFNPSWEIWPRQHDEREAAMAQDAMPSTHAIQQPIRDVTEANSAFDDISYQKGEQIIRMIEDWLGPDAFRDGMRGYMKAHAYSNATSADLWAALSAAAHRDVAPIAGGFTEQPGIPLVHMARSCTGGQGAVTLTQDRFAIHDPTAKPLRWTIPVALGTPGMASRHVLLGTAPMTLPLDDCAQPLKANWGEVGYFRTEYDAASLHALSAVLGRLEPVDRANLMGDQFALFLAGRAALADYLELLSDLATERDIVVWQDALAHLRRLDSALLGSPERKRFDAYAIGLIKPALARLGWDPKADEPFLDSLLRPDLIAALGQLGDSDTIVAAQHRFQEFLENPKSLPAALREPVLTIVGQRADQATYDALRKLGLAAASTEEKLRYFDAMVSASDPALMKQTVAFFGSGAVPNGRLERVIREASRTTENADLLYALVVPHEAELAMKLPGDDTGPTVLDDAATGSSNPETARALLAAKSSLASSGARILAARIADEINVNAELKLRVAPAISSWFAAHQY